MEELFIILGCYESWTDKGKLWGKWYVRDSKPRTLKDALKRIESLKRSSARTAKITRLNYRFKVMPVKEYEKLKTSLGAF